MNLLKGSWQRLKQLGVHPAQYFEREEATVLDGTLVVLALFCVTFAQKLVWHEPSGAALAPLAALEQAATNSLLVWALFCVYFYALAAIFRREVDFLKLMGWVGCAGAPLVLTTLLSALTWGAAIAFPLWVSLPNWLGLQEGFSWLGLALSWPGVYGYFLLRNGLKLRTIWAILFCALALGVFIAGGIVSAG